MPILLLLRAAVVKNADKHPFFKYYSDQNVRICHQKLVSFEDRRIEVRLKQLLRPQEYQGFHFLQVTLLTQSLTTNWNPKCQRWKCTKCKAQFQATGRFFKVLGGWEKWRTVAVMLTEWKLIQFDYWLKWNLRKPQRHTYDEEFLREGSKVCKPGFKRILKDKEEAKGRPTKYIAVANWKPLFSVSNFTRDKEKVGVQPIQNESDEPGSKMNHEQQHSYSFKSVVFSILIIPLANFKARAIYCDVLKLSNYWDASDCMVLIPFK